MILCKGNYGRLMLEIANPLAVNAVAVWVGTGLGSSKIHFSAFAALIVP